MVNKNSHYNIYFKFLNKDITYKMAFYGVQLDVAVRELNLKFKLAIQ